MLFSLEPTATCKQRAKSCNHPGGHNYCCTGHCGHRKYAVVPGLSAPASIHTPVTSAGSVDVDVRTGLYIRHFQMAVLDSSVTSSICSKVKPPVHDKIAPNFNGLPAFDWDSVTEPHELARVAAVELGAAGQRVIPTGGGSGGPHNKGGSCSHFT
jgi:hypothetical protein